MKSLLIHRQYLGLGLAMACGWSANLWAEQAAAKTHVLFMGADLLVERDKKPYRIEDVSGSQFKITVDGREIMVPTRNRQTGLGIAYNLKLSGMSVKLAELQSGPGYTAANDPIQKMREVSGNASALQFQQEMAEANLARLTQAETQLQIAVDAGGYGLAENQAQLEEVRAEMRKVSGQIDVTRTVSASDYANLGSAAHRMQVAEGSYDAMVVSFKISSEAELTSPYVVALFRFHDPAAKPGVIGMVIHAQALDPIDAKPRYIRIVRGGLPLGFEAVDCTVHVYNRGREVATNVSEKRVELTHDEAQQYFVMEYLGANKQATAAAAAVPGSLPPDARQLLSSDQLTRTLHAKISKDGQLLGLFTDVDCNHPLKDSSVQMVANELLFKPALDQGKPIEGIARMRLAEL